MQKWKRKWTQTKRKFNSKSEKNKQETKLPIQYSYVLYSSEYLSKNMN